MTPKRKRRSNAQTPTHGMSTRRLMANRETSILKRKFMYGHLV
jgi:hypothetical protein